MTNHSAEPLLLVPGLMCTSEVYADQLAAFAPARDVLIADHRRQATMEAIAADILDRAPPRFALAGLSMGGYIAFEILRQAPARVSRLALIDSNARADRPEQIKMRQLGIGMAHAIGVRAAQSFFMPMLIHPARLADAPLVERILGMADGTGVAAFERQQRAIMGRRDNRPFLSAIKCPTTIIVGEQDRLTPVKVAQEMADGIAGSRLKVIPDCGHLSTMERPEAVNMVLREWLEA